MKKGIVVLIFLICTRTLFAQDSVHIPVKVRHAEPLYIDLIRDLGARKGEKEWNAGWSSENQNSYIGHTGFVEYEFAPVNRLGFEVEIPFKFYRVLTPEDQTQPLFNRVEGIKLASQYTLLVSQRHQLSLAIGYIHELKLHSFYTMYHTRSVLKGNGFNPFLVIAKKIGNRIHTLVYTGPAWEHTPNENVFLYQLNSSVHYMLPTKHFIGIELNEEFVNNQTELIARPQIKVVLASNLAIGFATGIPVHAENHGMSFLARLIFEPAGKK